MPSDLSEIPPAARWRSRDGELILQGQCPNCHDWCDLDEDQWNGRVSTHHEKCGWYETVKFGPPTSAEWKKTWR